MLGYHAQTTIIDLTSQTWRREALDEETLANYIGGAGLAAYLLYRHCPPGAEPLSPENPLIFATSPLVGSKLTTSSKFAVASKSPLTGMIGDSLSSSFLATELKKTGSDAIVIVGAAQHLTLLEITDDDARFHDASDLAGLTTSATEEAVKTRLSRMHRVACIGPAGENLVRFAGVSNDGGRQAARAGPGAVMGSKRLKAIAVRGRRGVAFAHPEALATIRDDLARRSLGHATEKYRTLGTLANVSVFNRLGTLPTRNFQQSSFEGAENVSGEVFRSAHHVKNAHCANCTIGCEHVVATNDNGAAASGRMEYQSGFALGPLVGVDDPNTVIRASRLCDELGMDTISAGGVIAWAMEGWESGVLTSEDTGGVEIRFGDGEAVLDMLESIAHRRGFGALLAEGTRRAADAIGRGSHAWAMHVKGLEMPGYEPRSLKTMALALAVSTRGACHNRSSAYEADFSNRVDRLAVDDERGRITMEGEDYSAAMDSLIWCKFLRKAFTDFYGESAAIYERLTGRHMAPDDLRKAGERINNLRKLFNLREGWRREDDTLPPRVLQESLSTGVVKGIGLTQSELDGMIGDYYRARGWTEDGRVTPAKLDELGLTDLAAEADTAALPQAAR